MITEDLIIILQTCKYLYEAIRYRSIWAKLYSDLRVGFTRSPITLTSTEILRQRVVQNAAVDSEWRNPSSGGRRVTAIDHKPESLSYPETVTAVRILPGGAHILCIFSDGAMEIYSVSTPSAPIHFEPAYKCSRYSKSKPKLCCNWFFRYNETYSCILLQLTLPVNDDPITQVFLMFVFQLQ